MKKLIYISVFVIITILILFHTKPSKVSYEKPQIAEAQELQGEEENRQILYDELLPVCGCESMGDPTAEPQQFNPDGTIRRGEVNPKDIGMCQISTTYWLDMSVKLGYDLYTEQGNALMANWIYDNYGIEQWNWSRSCWGNSV